MDGQPPQNQGRQAVGTQHRKGQLFAALGRVPQRVRHRQQQIGKLLGLLPGKIQGNGLCLPHRVQHHPAGTGQAVDQGLFDHQRRQPVRTQGTVQPHPQPPADVYCALGIHLPAAAIVHRPAHDADKEEQHKVLPQCRTQSVPVAGKKHLYQRQKVHQQRFAQQMQRRQRVEVLFPVHTLPSISTAASAAACAAGMPGSTNCSPGLRTISTVHPAAHSSGVRSS